MRIILAVVALVAAQAGMAQPVPAEPPVRSALVETVTVSGTGRVTMTPDRYTFTVGVQTVAKTVDDAVRQNNSRVANVIAALKKAGATETEIRTSNFAIWPQQDYAQGKMPTITGYQVTNSITVRRDKPGDAGHLLQTAIDAGVNTSSGLQFEVSNPSSGREAGLNSAFLDARSAAAALARAAGRTLGRAIIINESGSAPPPQPMYDRMTMRAAAPQAEVPVEPGTQEMTYAVTVTFELK